MSQQLIELSNIEPAQLDSALSLGWFRIQQTIFTTDILCFDEQVYDAIWLRVRLHDFIESKKHKILSRKNSRFRIEINKALITSLHEALYASYKKNISFEGAPSLHALLYGKSNVNAFNTYMLDIYDGDVLIGSGGFDLGESSAAGIYSIYDPAYKKFSLGKYIIYEKIRYCKKENFTYFYPGYFVPGYQRFDYKLEIGKPAIEYFDAVQKKWFQYYG